MSTTPTFQETQKSQAEKLVEHTRQLFELRRYADSESKARQLLAYEPQNWVGHYFLAASLISQADDDKPEKIKEGLREAQKAVVLRPDLDSSYFLLGWAHLANHKPDECLNAVHQGMRIDAEEAWGYSLAARAHLFKKDWEKALKAADTGLKIDPQHINLLNARALALIMLSRKPEARSAVEDALRSDPSSSQAHVNRGWLALYSEDPKQALLHFREALRLDPTSEAARSGLMESLHARNPLYRLLLRYYLWARRLPRSELWAFWVLISGVNNALRLFVRVFPPLAIIILPYFLLYMIFSFFTWVGDSFFNLLLRLSPTGRLVMNADEKGSAAGCGFLGMLFLINSGAFIAALFKDPLDFKLFWPFLVGAVLSLGTMVPIAGIYKVDASSRNRRAILITIAVLMCMNAACGWGGSFVLAPWDAIPILFFLIGWLSYPWIATIIFNIE